MEINWFQLLVVYLTISFFENLLKPIKRVCNFKDISFIVLLFFSKTPLCYNGNLYITFLFYNFYVQFDIFCGRDYPSLISLGALVVDFLAFKK